MGDTYSAGQAGAIGPGATASQLTFQQVWAQLQGSTSVEELAKQLGALRMAMRSAASDLSTSCQSVPLPRQKPQPRRVTA